MFSIDHRYRRPEKTRLAERLAELRMAKRYDWDLNMLRGKLPTSEARRGNHYRLLNPYTLLFLRRPKVDVVRLPYWLRLGNAIQQLRNALQVAEKLGAGTIQFVESHPLFEGSRIGNFELVWGDGYRTTPTLEGEFFNAKTFRLNSSGSEIARVFTELVRPLLATPIREADPRLRPDDLVLHFRAGDIFGSSKPSYLNYGQPPLSYYLAAVDREQPSRIWLVYEDRSNPCIADVEAALQSRGIKVLVQSGTLEEDVRLLLSASALVAGRGSFAFMVAHLSKRLRKAYFFHQGNMEALCELGVDVILASDTDGEYKTKLLTNNWVGSAEQRSLMISYSVDKLEFRRALCAAPRIKRDRAR
jgi:hypothetical protein